MLKRKKVRKGSRYILAVILIIVIVISVVNIFIQAKTVEKKTFYSKLVISDFYGFDINGTALIFGVLMPGGSSSRSVSISNNYGHDIRVRAYVSGNISDFVFMDENDFIVRKNEARNISFVARVPFNASLGTYEGEVSIFIR